MGIEKLDIAAFMEKSRQMPVLDVRSPSEYHHAHIPGAFSLPLFSDEERKLVGTAYKQESREKAIKIGMAFFGKKMVDMVEAAEKIIVQRKAGKEVAVHCWRGGMRSAAVAWLLDLYGFKVYLLTGGYKAYRHHVLDLFEKPYPLVILGGYTGSNKTGLLTALAKAGGRMIDLEGLAGHKGSAFGNLEQEEQPGQEYFENLLAQQLESLAGSSEPVWVEGESQRIGFVNIPLSFFKTMRESPLVFLDVPFEARLDHIVSGYGKHSKDKLINAIMRIKKRLGGLETKNAVNCLLEEDVRGCFAILLKYYDRLYIKSTLAPPEAGERQISYVNSATTDAKENLQKILSYDTI